MEEVIQDSPEAINDELTLDSLKNAISTGNIADLNLHDLRDRKKKLSQLYTDYLKECSTEDNWLDASFIPNIRLLAFLIAWDAKLTIWFPDKKVKALHKFINMFRQFFEINGMDLGRPYPSPEQLESNIYRAVEWIYLRHLLACFNGNFRQDDKLEWLAIKLLRYTNSTRRQLQAPKGYGFHLETAEYNFTVEMRDEEAQSILLLNDISASQYFTALQVLFLCEIDPSKYNFKKIFFELKWEMFLDCYSSEKSFEAREILVEKLKATIDLENADTNPIKQKVLNELLGYINHRKTDQGINAENNLLAKISNDVFRLIIQELIDIGDMKSIANARQTCKQWKEAIDKAPIWTTMLAEIGGRMWTLHHVKPAKEVIAEKFSPASIYVLQCYGFIKKMEHENWAKWLQRLPFLWGVLTNNTQLALLALNDSKRLPHGGAGRYSDLSPEYSDPQWATLLYKDPFQANALSIAAAYGRTEIVEILTQKEYTKVKAKDGKNVGRIQPVNGWPLVCMIYFTNDCFSNALSFCHIETTRRLLDKGENLLTWKPEGRYIHHAFISQYPNGQSSEMMKMLLNELITDPHKLYAGKAIYLYKLITRTASFNDTECFEQLIVALPKLDSGHAESVQFSIDECYHSCRQLIENIRADRLALLLKTNIIYEICLYIFLLIHIDNSFLKDWHPHPNYITLIEHMKLYTKHFDDSEKNQKEITRCNELHKTLYSILTNTYKGIHIDTTLEKSKKTIQNIWAKRTKYATRKDDCSNDSSDEYEYSHDDNNNNNNNV